MAISRIEQISPLDYESLLESIDKYPNALLLFAQEEPVNGGAWSYLEPRLRRICMKSEHHKDNEFLVSARPPTSSVATGHKAAHVAEVKNYLHNAFHKQRGGEDEVASS